MHMVSAGPSGVLCALLIAPLASHALGAQTAAPKAAYDTTINVRANSSTLEFDPPILAVRHGVRVRLRFTNSGSLPHNFVIVRDENDIDDLAAAAMRQGGNYIPATMTSKMIAYTTLASPAQTLEVIFTMPAAGEYTYVCLMSGHANSMLGKLRSLR